MTNKIEVAVDKEKLYVLEGDFDYETQIENILEFFDFERVKKAMKALFGITENSLSDVSYKVKPFWNSCNFKR